MIKKLSPPNRTEESFFGHDPLLPCSHGMLQDEYATFEGTAGLRVVQKKPISSSLKAKAVVLGFLLLAIGAFVGQKASQALAAPLELTDVAEGASCATGFHSNPSRTPFLPVVWIAQGCGRDPTPD